MFCGIFKEFKVGKCEENVLFFFSVIFVYMGIKGNIVNKGIILVFI